MVLTNEGLVIKKIKELVLTIKGIKENTDIGLFMDLGDPISIANFPKSLVKINVLEKKVNNKEEEDEKREWFVEPGIVQKFSYVAQIPEDIRFILVRCGFKYQGFNAQCAEVFMMKLIDCKKR